MGRGGGWACGQAGWLVGCRVGKSTRGRRGGLEKGAEGTRGRVVLAQPPPPPPMFVIVVSRFRRGCMPGEGGSEEEPSGGSGGGAWARGKRKLRPRAHPGRPRGPLKRRSLPAAVNRPVRVPAPRPPRSRASAPSRPYPSTGNETGSSSRPPLPLTGVKSIAPPAGEGGAGCTHRPGWALLAAAQPGPPGRTGPCEGTRSF
ncbi:uncharacterized protein FN964_001685 [Alca torda]